MTEGKSRLKTDQKTEAKDHLKKISKVNPARLTSKTKDKINKDKNIQRIPTKQQTKKTNHQKSSR